MAKRRAAGRVWLLALLIDLAAAGICRWLLLREQTYPGRYFLAIAISMFLILLSAVVLSVWQERAGLAGAFVVLAGALAAVVFYPRELSEDLVTAELIVGAVAVTAWLLAVVGCQLRRRLREMDADGS